MYEIGPFAADYFLYEYLNMKMTKRSLEDHRLYLYALSANAMDVDQVKTNVGSKRKREGSMLDHLRLHLGTFSSYLSPDFEIPNTWLSPKMLTLVDILQAHNSANFHGILFVEQRQVANLVSWILRRLPQLKAWVRCAELIGHAENGKTDGAPGMGMKVQRDVVKAFREGSLNLCTFSMSSRSH